MCPIVLFRKQRYDIAAAAAGARMKILDTELATRRNTRAWDNMIVLGMSSRERCSVRESEGVGTRS